MTSHVALPVSDTPRTDAIRVDPIGDSDGAMEAVSLARTLERELAECRKCLSETQSADRALLRRLSDAVDEVLAPLGYHGEICARDDRVSALHDVMREADAVLGKNGERTTPVAWEAVLREYPNLHAILEGRVSGRFSEWPTVPLEIESLCRRLSEASSWAELAADMLRDSSLFMQTQVKPGEYNSLADRIDRFLERTQHSSWDVSSTPDQPKP